MLVQGLVGMQWYLREGKKISQNRFRYLAHFLPHLYTCLLACDVTSIHLYPSVEWVIFRNTHVAKQRPCLTTFSVMRCSCKHHASRQGLRRRQNILVLISAPAGVGLESLGFACFKMGTVTRRSELFYTWWEEFIKSLVWEQIHNQLNLVGFT